MSEKRELIATLLEGAGRLTVNATSLSGDPDAVAVGALVSGLVGLTASLVRSLGAQNAQATLKALKDRVDKREGEISASDLENDDARVEAFLDDLFGPGR